MYFPPLLKFFEENFNFGRGAVAVRARERGKEGGQGEKDGAHGEREETHAIRENHGIITAERF